MVLIPKYPINKNRVDSHENTLINSMEAFFPDQDTSNSILLTNLNDFSNPIGLDSRVRGHFFMVLAVVSPNSLH